MAKVTPYEGQYATIPFPDYVYEHYPLAMHQKGNPDHLVVNNEDEEKAAIEEGWESPHVGPPANVTVADVEELKGDIAERDAQIEALRAKIKALETPVTKPLPAPSPKPMV